MLIFEITKLIRQLFQEKRQPKHSINLSVYQLSVTENEKKKVIVIFIIYIIYILYI